MILFNAHQVILEYQFIPHDAPPGYTPVTIGAPPTSDPLMDAPPTSHPLPPLNQVTTPPNQNLRSTTRKHNGIIPDVHVDTTSTRQDLQRAHKSSSSVSSTGFQNDPGYQTRYNNGCGHSPPEDHAHDEYEDHYGYNYYEEDPQKLSDQGDFEPGDRDSVEHGAPLSQVIEDPTNEPFSNDVVEHANHPITSQVSVHSFDGVSQPSLSGSQRFVHSPSNDYDLTPASQGEYRDSQSMGEVSRHSNATLPDSSVKGPVDLDSPNLNGTKFHFTESRSMERLSDIPMNTRQMGGGHDRMNTPQRTPSFQHAPELSQDPTGMGYTHHEGYPMQDPYSGMMVMSQDHYGWSHHRNPRMYSSMHRTGYPPPPRGGPPIRGPQYGHEYGMNRPEFDQGSVNGSYSGGDNEFRSHYPPAPSMMYSPQQQQMFEKEKRRKSLHEQENMKMGRGPYHPMQPYTTDMFGYQRQYYGHLPLDEDPSIEYACSQPSTYMMYPPQQHSYNRFPPGYQQSPMNAGGHIGMGMNRMGGGRLGNVPSEYSLSQGGEPRMRNVGFGGERGMGGKPKKSALRNGNERK